jgi:hypothetical protein
MAASITCSRVSFAWPGQNCPEWLCMEKAMTSDFFGNWDSVDFCKEKGL